MGGLLPGFASFRARRTENWGSGFNFDSFSEVPAKQIVRRWLLRCWEPG